MIDFLLRPIRRNFGRDRAYYRIVDDLFGFIPHNVELYKLALIHKSASLVLEDGRAINNERLEYLGDAVIEAVTSDYLFIEYPDRDEGFMTQLRSKIVSRQSLNALAVNLGLDVHVISNGGTGITQKHIYGDAFEAMMGAVYLDQGYEFRTEHDKEYASNHPVFYCTVLVDGMEVGHGAGDSKKEAEQRAAFSVSQYMSDEQCASLLDKVDRLEGTRSGSGF